MNSDKVPINQNRNLIPFVQFDSENEKKWGYLDEDTGEIVIEAQYIYTTPFIGGFAAVIRNRFDDQIIINKDGKVISVPRFDEVHFIASESGKNTLAILKTRHTRQKFDFGLFSNRNAGFYPEEYHKYSLYNMITRKTIRPKKEDYIIYDMETVGDYFTVRTNLYQFMDNGDVKLVVKNNSEEAATVLKEYFEECGINIDVKGTYTSIDINYSPYIEAKYADSDLSGAFENLPPDFKIPFKRAEPFYRDPRELLNAPLVITERKYLLHFHNEKTGEIAVGIYNESKEEWELLPSIAVTYFSGKTELYYVVEILQTNNPYSYQLHLKNNDIGWGTGKYAIIGGGIFNVTKGNFMDNLHLFEDYPPRTHIIMYGGSGKRMIRFPEKGVYYRDYAQVRDLPWE